MPPRRIDNDDLEALLLELGYTLRGDSDGVGLRIRTKVRDFGFCGGLPSLIESTRTESIGTNNCGFEPPFLIMNGEFGAGRCFPVTLGDICLRGRLRHVVRIRVPADLRP